MKLGIVLTVLGAIFGLDGILRIILIGWPGLTGLVIGIPLVYFGVKRIQWSQEAKDKAKGKE